MDTFECVLVLHSWSKLYQNCNKIQIIEAAAKQNSVIIVYCRAAEISRPCLFVTNPNKSHIIVNLVVFFCKKCVVYSFQHVVNHNAIAISVKLITIQFFDSIIQSRCVNIHLLELQRLINYLSPINLNSSY